MNAHRESISIFPNTLSKQIVHSFISESAYYKAEKKGLESGHEEQDWAEAERDIKSCLNGYFDLAFHSSYN